MNKKELRKIALQKRAEIFSADAAVLLSENFLSAVSLPENSVVAAYIPANNEIDVSDICFALADEGHLLCLPRIDGENMNFHAYEIGDELQPNKFGILEPLPTAKIVEPQALIIPMLAFDYDKNRLGYGGGYYDRYMQNRDVLKVGVAYAAQQFPSIPTESHDIKLDKIITEDFIL